MTLPPLGDATTRTDLVAASIKSAILSGELKPDEVLVERRIAERLGVSKTPVREALIALTASGLLVQTRNRGVTVRRLQPEDVLRIYEMRRLLEPWAAGEAAASDFDPTEARQALDEADRFVAADDRAALTLANRRFHRCLYASCPNPLVVATLDGLQDLTALGITSLLWEQWPTWRDEMAEHRVILKAVEKRDSKAAERLVRRHIEQSITRLRTQTRLRTIFPHLDEPVAR